MRIIINEDNPKASGGGRKNLRFTWDCKELIATSCVCYRKFVHSRRSAFTLIELLATIAILAALIVGALFAYVSVTSWAKATADKQTLTILNDALTRYKTQGGNVSALTVGADIGAVLSRMQNSTTWGSISHQFLRQGVTYPARSLGAMGSGASYNFYRYNTYSSTTPGAGTPTNQYIYGQGTGYMADASGSYQFECTTSTNYVALKQSNGTVTIFEADSVSLDTFNPADSVTFWSCASDVDPTPSGTITTLYCSGDAYTGQITALNVSGLTSITSLDCSSNQIDSLNVSGLTAMTDFNCSGNLLTSINVSGLTALQTLTVSANTLGTWSVSGLPALTDLDAGACGLTAFSFSGLPLLSHLGLASNSLDSTALNSIYTALPDRTSLSAGFIGRIGNPGAGGATNSIATSKNWTMH